MCSSVMMPLTMKTADSLEGRGAIVHDILSIDMDGLLTNLLPIAFRELERTKPFGKLMFYLKALQYSTTPAEFEKVVAVVHASVSTETFEKLEKAGVTGPGKLSGGKLSGGAGGAGAARRQLPEATSSTDVSADISRRHTVR